VETGRLEVRHTVAREVGGIDVEQLALALAGHLKEPVVELPYFGELAEAWLEHIRSKRVQPDNEERLLRRLKPLYLETEATLTAAMAAELIDSQPGYGPSSKNKLRGVGRMVVDHAAAAQRWNRPNPFGLVKRKKEARRKYEGLTLEELALVQRHLREDRRLLFRVALHTGLRPGELFALRVDDLDFPNRVIHVRRSRDRETTKTGTTRDLPMHPAIECDLLDAATTTKSDLVFGHSFDGSLQSQNTKITRILRTAMVAAGVGVTGVDWKCRRKGCGFTEHVDGAPTRKREARYCPRCDFRLWGVVQVKPVRWYDLRHMCATFHHEAGADRLCISIALGHSIESITEEVYTHPTMARLAAELSKWRLPR
jgi:integrase